MMKSYLSLKINANMDAEQELNPLAMYVLVAAQLVQAFEEKHGIRLPHETMLWPFNWREEAFPRAAGGHCLYSSREQAGIAGLYDWIASHDLGDVVFANELSWEIHGIDAVIRDRRTGRYILCEAKGTERSIIGGPLSYLRRTIGKGRQLSWRWCWTTLIDFACRAPTAPVFLKLLEPFLAGDIERLLVVTELRTDSGGWRLVGSRAWREVELAGTPELAVPHDLERQRGWLREIQKQGGVVGLVQRGAM